MPAQVAGLFYPAEADQCAALIDAAMARATPPALAPKAVVAPHAGYVYSAPIAGSAYKLLAQRKDEIKRVVLTGPNHRMPLRGMAAPSAESWSTPFGPLPIDRASLDKALSLPDIAVNDSPFAGEHSLDVHMPFIKRVLGDVAVLPILIGQAKAESVGRVLDALWGGPETAIVISSDLSHFHDYETARAKDGEAGKAIEALRSDLLKDDMACGRYGIHGLIERARSHDLRATAIDIRNSGDTAGGKDRVVGYGAFAFEYAHCARIGDQDRATLLDVAKRVVREGARTGAKPALQIVGAVPPTLAALRATFVTLTIGGKLRGCIGSTAPHRRLIDDVAENAWKSAFGDPRFPKLTEAEHERLEFHISILSTARPISFGSEAALARALRPDRDGLIIRDQGKSAIFLPSVWQSLPDPAQFVRHLKTKARLGAEHWSDTLQALRYTTESFGDRATR
jgi:hypothetical protein